MSTSQHGGMPPISVHCLKTDTRCTEGCTDNRGQGCVRAKRELGEVIRAAKQRPAAAVLPAADVARAVTAERRAVYGDPAIHFDRTARLAAVIQECPDPRIRHAMYMICDKLARLIETPSHCDGWDDIQGYARTAKMILKLED